jgi:HEAT repeat protein
MWPNEPLDAAMTEAESARRHANTAEVWRVDVLEWERAGSAAEACADVMVDARLPDFVRRKAMLARLTALTVEGEVPGRTGTSEACVRLAGELGQLQLYAVLSPLEHLFERPERDVRIAVLAAIETLFFKRSFVTVRAGLVDPDARVAARAAAATEALVFEHAFDPLARLAQATDANVRGSAIKAIARIDTTEAAEFLLGVLEHGARSDRTVATDALKVARGSRFVDLARDTLGATGRTDPELQASLQAVLSARGIAPPRAPRAGR